MTRVGLQIYDDCAYVATSTGAAFTGFTLWGTGFTADDQLADFNGDFRDDIIQFYNGNAYVALTNGAGTGFLAWALWGTGFSADDQQGDFNGDGRTDVLHVDANGNALVALANGTATGFAPFKAWGTGMQPGDHIAEVTGAGCRTSSSSTTATPMSGRRSRCRRFKASSTKQGGGRIASASTVFRRYIAAWR